MWRRADQKLCLMGEGGGGRGEQGKEGGWGVAEQINEGCIGTEVTAEKMNETG